MLTQTAVQDFLISRGGLRPKTLVWYKRILAPFAADFPELPLTPAPVQCWLNSFAHLEPATQHGYYRALRALYRQTAKWHPHVINPMSLINAPRVPAKHTRTFTAGQLARMFVLPLSARDRALITLLVDTGVRAGECVSLSWQDLSGDAAVVSGKTGRRLVPLSPETVIMLRRLRPEGADGGARVWQGRRGALTECGVYKIVHRVCLQAGLEGGRLCPHTFRHTFGTEMMAAPGGDPQVLQLIMGHRDPQTTRRYCHASYQHILDNHRRCTPLRAVAAAAQGELWARSAVEEGERIIRSGDQNDGSTSAESRHGMSTALPRL